MTDEIRKARVNAKKVAIQLWKIRKEMGLTQDEFAARYLIEKSAVANFERGRSVPLYIALLYAANNPARFMEEVNKVYGESIRE